MHDIRHEYSLILLVQCMKTPRKNSRHQYLRICIFKNQSKHSKTRVTTTHYTAGVNSTNSTRRASDRETKRKLRKGGNFEHFVVECAPQRLVMEVTYRKYNRLNFNADYILFLYYIIFLNLMERTVILNSVGN